MRTANIAMISGFILAFAATSAAAQTQNGKAQKAAKKPSFEECQKRAQKLGLDGRSGGGTRGDNSFMGQCMAGKV